MVLVDRRLGFALFVAAALVSPAALAQTGDRVYRLGHLTVDRDITDVTIRWMLPELEKYGFVVGRNLIFDARIGTPAEMPVLARALIAANPDAIIVVGRDALRATGEATRTVPIIASGQDAVGYGFAQSLARPGGNVTGVAYLFAELDGKRLQLLHEALPRARRIAALLGSPSIATTASERAMRGVAASLGFELRTFYATSSEAYSAAFAAMRAYRAEALIISATPEFYRDQKRIIALALGAQLPTSCWWAEMAAAGCVLAYGPNRADLRRRLAQYVVKIFRGARPSDLPIEQPTKFDLAINLKTAKALGLNVPDSIVVRADEIIE